MGLKYFEISFDNPSSTYTSGDSVTGWIKLTLPTSRHVHGIVLHFKGEAIVFWAHGTSEHTGTETYFDRRITLVEVEENGAVTTLPAGDHFYQFQIELPTDLPSSFEAEFGNVRYSLKVTLGRPWKLPLECRAAFRVISPLDLNLHPSAWDPVKVTQVKHLSSCFGKSGSVLMTVLLPVSGYVSGQLISVTVTVDNINTKQTCDVTCKLRKLVTFNSKKPLPMTKYQNVTIEEFSFGAVDENSSQTWTKSFVMPVLPPSNLENCNLIDLEYYLMVEGKMSGFFNRSVDVKIPLIFGTIPFIDRDRWDGQINGTLL